MTPASPSALEVLDAFYQEHRLCGDMDGGVDETHDGSAYGWFDCLTVGSLTYPRAFENHGGELLTVPEVARELKVDLARGYELTRNGDLRSVRVGERQVRVRRSDLDEYLATTPGRRGISGGHTKRA